MGYLLIFDLDGVLVDLCALHRNIFISAFNQLIESFKLDDQFHARHLEALSTRSKLKKLTEMFPQLEKEIQFENIYDLKQKLTEDQLSQLSFSNKVKEIFTYLHQCGHKIAVFTNSIRKTLNTVLSKLDIQMLVDFSLSNEDVSKCKPHPEGYIKIIDRFKFEKENVYIFEDSDVGLEAARETGANLIPLSNSLDLTLNFIKTILKKKFRLVIPMAGMGSRFSKVGYFISKPFLPMPTGRKMWEEVVLNLLPKNIELRKKVEVHLIVREEDLLSWKECLPNGIYVHTVPRLTEGAACTVLTIKDIINDSVPLLLGNSDQYLEWNVDKFYQSAFHSDYDGAISSFYHPYPEDLRWSYINENGDGLVKEVAEKKYIGVYATTGIYAWKRGSDFVKFAEEMIKANDRINNEFYICPVYNYAIKAGLKIRHLECTKFWGTGIPEDYNNFIENYSFEKDFTEMVTGNERLEDVYTRILCKNSSKLPGFFVPGDDLCLAIWQDGNFSLNENYYLFKKALSFLDGKIQFYGEEPHLHHTFFQLKTFGTLAKNYNYSGKITKYKEKIREAMKILPPYYLKFWGISPGKDSLFLCGYPPEGYNNLRKEIKELDPDFVSEPYKQNIHHVTILRWIKQLTKEEYQRVIEICKLFERVNFGMFQPTRWNIGYATWSMNPNDLGVLSTWEALPAPWVLHRGNTKGIGSTENHPEQLLKLSKQGWDAEVDVWLIEGKYFLGHDKPEHSVTEEYLLRKNFWLHCKNKEAYFALKNSYHCFFHDKDEFTMTTEGIQWFYPEISSQEKGSVFVVKNVKYPKIPPGFGICSDYLPQYNSAEFVFVISTCVNSNEHLKVFQRCYQSLLKFNPEKRIIVVDGGSQINYQESFMEVYSSPKPGSGILGAIELFHQHKWGKGALFLHDSSIAIKAIPDISEECLFLWHFDRSINMLYHDHDSVRTYERFLKQISESPEQVKEIQETFGDSWPGCFGPMLYLSQTGTEKLAQKGLFSLVITTLTERCCSERFIAYLCYKSGILTKKSLQGHVDFDGEKGKGKHYQGILCSPISSLEEILSEIPESDQDYFKKSILSNRK